MTSAVLMRSTRFAPIFDTAYSRRLARHCAADLPPSFSFPAWIPMTVSTVAKEGRRAVGPVAGVAALGNGPRVGERLLPGAAERDHRVAPRPKAHVSSKKIKDQKHILISLLSGLWEVWGGSRNRCSGGLPIHHLMQQAIV